MRTLGIDPGIRCTGYGVISRDGIALNLVDFGVIRPQTDAPMPQRLNTIYEDVCQLIEQFQPDEFAVEDSFYGVNAKSALILGQARGVAIVAAARFKIPVTEYTPRKVKKAVTGSGSATKEQIQYMIQHILNLPQPPQPLDASDALAVALCHMQQLQLPGGRS